MPSTEALEQVQPLILQNKVDWCPGAGSQGTAWEPTDHVLGQQGSSGQGPSGETQTTWRASCSGGGLGLPKAWAAHLHLPPHSLKCPLLDHLESAQKKELASPASGMVCSNMGVWFPAVITIVSTFCPAVHPASWPRTLSRNGLDLSPG